MNVSAKQYRQLSIAIMSASENRTDDIIYQRRLYTFLKHLTGAEVEILEDGFKVSVNGSVVNLKDGE